MRFRNICNPEAGNCGQGGRCRRQGQASPRGAHDGGRRGLSIIAGRGDRLNLQSSSYIAGGTWGILLGGLERALQCAVGGVIVDEMGTVIT
jgi:hypothetical protein